MDRSIESKLTVHDLLFRNSHLVVDESMLFNVIAQSNEFPPELFEGCGVDDGLRFVQRLPALDHVLRQIVLALQGREPSAVEFVPESDAVVMQCFVVSC